jgi:hypothetical protein
VVQGNEELGLPGFPTVPLLPVGWGQVAGGAELACSQFATMHRLLWEMLAMVGQDVLQLARIRLMTGREKASLPDFFRFFLF